MVSVKWTRDALKDLEKIDRIVVMRILEKIRWFESNFASVVPEPLHRNLRGLYKLRVGDYRVVYKIEANEVWVLGIRHRKTVYEDILQRLTDRD